ncbi:MAG: Smr/MutS family protein [Nitrospirae bacterium]|nr:Smr/MutS family protein [Nitrospirota bacterium]
MKPTKHSYKSFRDLKEALDNINLTFCQSTIKDNRTDEEIFTEAMSDVREIKEFRDIPYERHVKIKFLKQLQDDSIEVLREIVKGKKKIRLSDTGEYIEWVHPDIPKNVAEKLHQGHFSVQDYIDMHGMTLDEAKDAFSRFFKDALKRRLFCIKVIHGRGLRSPKGAVLKEALQKWLRGSFRKWILAYSSARDCDGGLGATYIILKT